MSEEMYGTKAVLLIEFSTITDLTKFILRTNNNIAYHSGINQALIVTIALTYSRLSHPVRPQSRDCLFLLRSPSFQIYKNKQRSVC